MDGPILSQSKKKLHRVKKSGCFVCGMKIVQRQVHTTQKKWHSVHQP